MGVWLVWSLWVQRPNDAIKCYQSIHPILLNKYNNLQACSWNRLGKNSPNQTSSNMHGSKWNMLNYTLTSRGMGGSHGTMTCWLAFASTSFKNDIEHLQCLSMCVSLTKQHLGVIKMDGCVKES
jgi:hypothetical protein